MSSTLFSVLRASPITGATRAVRALDGCIERYRRTLSEEFIQTHEDLIRRYPQEFLRSLGEYLLFYTTQRIHFALDKQTISGWYLACFPAALIV